MLINFDTQYSSVLYSLFYVSAGTYFKHFIRNFIVPMSGIDMFSDRVQ